MSIRMIDVGDKAVTERTARAEGWIRLAPEVYQRVTQGQLPKGDGFLLAQVAGIQGAKRTADLLPLCHPLPIEGVKIDCQPLADSQTIRVEARVRTTGKTGVEMEALAAVSAALLCHYDLTKMFDATAEIGGIGLLEKTGGKSGHWQRPAIAPDVAPTGALAGVFATVTTVSDRVAADQAEDRSGPLIQNWLTDQAATIATATCVADEPALIQAAIQAAIAQGSALILLTGGTGLGPRDRTPEAIADLGAIPVPGIGEALRQAGRSETVMTWLPRSGGWMLEGSFVIALPGSSRAVSSGLAMLQPLLPHSLAILKGADHGTVKG
ncbi:molybdenum cofactor biosynthesis protein C [Synechococcus elongatus PCC 6301]|uniref:cyclic pyranopterin monophosphate synthase n=1 Tax=Synechococcus sp. (strain ATCC 27144 / PCC 6301 / SAUG 1402/1) TaxID=269084 RepID=A0A0H3K085_SYNP6|nr:bifunctional molybdenum cofactor biosynthesis protein MoaC/MoaB [Synechococcus elongatus]BAD78458.1 molybdenum cofactor biosynthesis protein C [Synechococcus elongatus PCC 6301]